MNKSCKRVAEIAQSVGHFTRNEGVVGSSPIFSCLKEDAINMVEIPIYRIFLRFGTAKESY